MTASQSRKHKKNIEVLISQIEAEFDLAKRSHKSIDWGIIEDLAWETVFEAKDASDCMVSI